MPLLVNNQVGQAGGSAIREDLADYIAIADARSCPFVSMAPKGRELGNMRFDWQVDSYGAPQLGGVIDGTDVTMATTSNPVADRTRLSNYAQAFRRNLRIGFIAETQNVAGVNSEVANGIAKGLLLLKRDMESTFCLTTLNTTVGGQLAVADNGSSTAYTTSSLGNWITNSASNTVGQAPAAYAPPANSKSTTATASFTETTFQDVLTSIYSQTGVFRDYDCILGTTLKRAFTNLTAGTNIQVANANAIAPTGVRTFNKELSDSTFSSSIDLVEGDFGKLLLHPSTFIGYNQAGTWTATPHKGYVLPMDMVEIRYSKLPEVKELPDYGGGPARLVQAICGLVVKNPLGLGMFTPAT